jgi:hypothetical protein
MSLIIATHWARNPYERCLEARETRRFGNMTAAKAWAASVLPDIVTTNDCYWRDVGRGESVELTIEVPSRLPYSFTRGRQSSKNRQAMGSVESKVVVVPSVGELGWTP